MKWNLSLHNDYCITILLCGHPAFLKVTWQSYNFGVYAYFTFWRAVLLCVTPHLCEWWIMNSYGKMTHYYYCLTILLYETLALWKVTLPAQNHVVPIYQGGPPPMKQIKSTIPRWLLSDNTTIWNFGCINSDVASTHLCGSRLSGGPPHH